MWIACRVFFGELQSLFTSTGFGENQVQVNLWPIVWTVNIFPPWLFLFLFYSISFYILCINVPISFCWVKLRIANLMSHYLGISFLNSTWMNIIRYLQAFLFYQHIQWLHCVFTLLFTNVIKVIPTLDLENALNC